MVNALSLHRGRGKRELKLTPNGKNLVSMRLVVWEVFLSVWDSEGEKPILAALCDLTHHGKAEATGFTPSKHVMKTTIQSSLLINR